MIDKDALGNDADEIGEGGKHTVESVGATADEPETFRPLSYIDVTFTLPAHYPVVTLQEFDSPHRLLSIPVGVAEGNAIAYAAKAIATARPMTHELMVSVFESFGLSVATLRITGAENGVFFAELVVAGAEGQRVVPCRVSDGIVLCLRQRPPVPITVSPSVIDQFGFPA